MLKLLYHPTNAGAPDDYGDATDELRNEAGQVVQVFAKAGHGVVQPNAKLIAEIDAWLAHRGARAEPPVLMVHGYMFDPADALDVTPDSPFGSIYGVPRPPPLPHNLSWLPLVGECDDAGAGAAENGIAFCYKSSAGFFEYGRAGWTNSYQHAVLDLAQLASRALSAVLAALASKGLKYRILAHSLGTRTTSLAIRALQDHGYGGLDRVVLLDGAEFSVDAALSFKNCPFDVFNFVNGDDKVLKIGADEMCHPLRFNRTHAASVIGRDGLGGNPNWMDLRLDNTLLGDWLAQGHAPGGGRYQIDPEAQEKSHSAASMNHWSCYTNDGNRKLVRDLLSVDAMTVAQMRAAGAPEGSLSLVSGQFDNFVIPVTPTSAAARQQLMAHQDLAAGTGG